MGLGPAYPPRPRPLPDRSAWRLSARVPAEGDRLRALAAADPGMAVTPYAERSPARQPQWAAARAADRAERSTVDRADTGPEIATEGICPRCGSEAWRDSADVGVGVIYGPWGCPCGWSESPEYDVSQGARQVDGYQVDQWGGLTPTGRRHAVDDPAPLEIPAGDPGADLDALIRSALTDPGPHEAEPATPRWRWWRRARTAWRARGDRKPKE